MVECLAGRDVLVETDEFTALQVGEINFLFRGELVLGGADGDELVFHKRNDFHLTILLRERYEAEVDGTRDNVFVDEVGATVFDAYIDVGELLHEALHVGG